MNKIKENILDAFNSRHSCREFIEDKKIEIDDIKFILETGRLSPSSFGFEPWHFLVIENESLKTELSEYSRGGKKQILTCSHLVIVLARKGSEFTENSDYLKFLTQEIMNLNDDEACKKIKTFMRFKNSFQSSKNQDPIFDWASKQCYIAASNMISSSAQISIDSCAIEGFDRQKITDVLIQNNMLDSSKFGVSLLISFGYCKIKNTAKKQRRDKLDVYKLYK